MHLHKNIKTLTEKIKKENILKPNEWLDLNQKMGI